MSKIMVSSGIIEHISYHDKILYVKLMDGQLLSYDSVPKEIFEEFAGTNAHDEFYKKRIISSFLSRRMA